MDIHEHFKVRTTPQVLQADLIGIQDPKDFLFEGAVGESENDFNDYCRASRVISDADFDEEQLEAIAVLLNRAVAYGRVLAQREAKA